MRKEAAGEGDDETKRGRAARAAAGTVMERLRPAAHCPLALSLSLALAPPPPHARQTPVRHTCPTARASCPCTCDLGARPKPAHPSRTCPHLPSDPGPRSTSRVPLRLSTRPRRSPSSTADGRTWPGWPGRCGRAEGRPCLALRVGVRAGGREWRGVVEEVMAWCGVVVPARRQAGPTPPPLDPHTWPILIGPSCAPSRPRRGRAPQGSGKPFAHGASASPISAPASGALAPGSVPQGSPREG